MMLTPAQAELYDVIAAECAEVGYAISLFRLGVVKAGQDYATAHRCLRSMVREKIVNVRRERNAPGRPLVISLRRDEDANIGIQPAGDAQE